MSTPNNILDWAETIRDLLYLVPREDRAVVLAKVMELVAEENKRDPYKGISFAELSAKSPPRNKHGEMLFKSRAVLSFTRDITNSHSTPDADKLLFMQHRGPGSGRLLDYIDDLPSLRRRVRAADEKKKRRLAGRR